MFKNDNILTRVTYITLVNTILLKLIWKFDIFINGTPTLVVFSVIFYSIASKNATCYDIEVDSSTISHIRNA